MMNLDIDGFSAQLNFLKGEVLTVIDASIPDDRRCKAVKDLIHKAFADRVRFVMGEHLQGETQSS